MNSDSAAAAAAAAAVDNSKRSANPLVMTHFRYKEFEVLHYPHWRKSTESSHKISATAAVVHVVAAVAAAAALAQEMVWQRLGVLE